MKDVYVKLAVAVFWWVAASVCFGFYQHSLWAGLFCGSAIMILGDLRER